MTNSIWKMLWPPRWANQTTSPENKTIRKPVMSTLKLTKYSPQKRLINSKTGIHTVKGLPSQKSITNQLTGNNQLENIIQSTTAVYRLTNEINFKTEPSRNIKKPEVSTINNGKYLQKAMDVESKIFISSSAGSSLRFSDQKIVSPVSSKFPEEKTSATSRIMRNRVAMETKTESKKVCEEGKNKESSKDTEKTNGQSSTHVTERSHETDWPIGTDCGDIVARPKKQKFIGNSIENFIEPDQRSQTKVIQPDMISESKVKQYGLQMTQSGYQFQEDENVHEPTLEIALQQKRMKERLNCSITHVTEEKPPNNKCKYVASDRAIHVKKPYLRSEMSMSSSAMAVDEATGDLLSGDFSSICRKYSTNDDSHETTASSTFPSAHVNRRKSKTEHREKEIKDKIASKSLSEKVSLKHMDSQDADIRNTVLFGNPMCLLDPTDVIPRRHAQLKSRIKDTPKYIEKLPYLSKKQGGDFKNVNQVDPKPSRKLVSANGSVVLQDDLSLHDNFYGRHLESSLSRHRPYKNKRKLTSSNISEKNKDKYTKSLGAQPSKVKGRLMSPVLSEFFTESMSSETITVANVLGRSTDTETLDSPSRFDVRSYANAVELSTHAVHSSSPISVTFQQLERPGNLDSSPSLQGTSKTFTLIRQSDAIWGHADKQTKVRNTKYLHSPQTDISTTRKSKEGFKKRRIDHREMAACDTYPDEEMGHDEVGDPEILEVLSQYEISLKKGPSLTPLEETPKETMSTWMSALCKGQSGHAGTDVTMTRQPKEKHLKMIDAHLAKQKRTRNTRAGLLMRERALMNAGDFLIGKHTEVAKANPEMSKWAQMSETERFVSKYTQSNQPSQSVNKYTQVTEDSHAMEKQAKTTQTSLAMEKQEFLSAADFSIGEQDIVQDTGSMMKNRAMWTGTDPAMRKQAIFADAGSVMGRRASLSDAGKTIDADRKSLSPPYVQGQCIVQDWADHEFLHQEHVDVDNYQLFVPSKNRKFASSTTPRSQIPVKKPGINNIGRVRKRRGYGVSSQMLRGVLGSKTRNEMPRKEPMYRFGMETGYNEANIQIGDAWREKFLDKLCRKISFDKTTKAGPHQMVRADLVKQLSNTPNSSQDMKRDTSRDKILQKTWTDVVPRLEKRGQYNYLRQRYHAQQKPYTNLYVNVNDSKSGFGVASDKNITKALTKSPDFVHIPLFENINSEAVNIILPLESSAQKALIKKQTLNAGARTVPMSQERCNYTKRRQYSLLEPAKPERKSSTQGSPVACLCTDMISISENQNASPRIFSEQNKRNKFRSTCINTENEPGPFRVREDTDELCHFRPGLLSKRRQHSQGCITDNKDDKSKDSTLNDCSQRTDLSKFDFSKEFVSTASSSQLEQELNSTAMTKTVETEDGFSEVFNKSHPAETKSTPTFKVSTDPMITRNRTFLLKKNYSKAGNRDKSCMSKTLNINYPSIFSQMSNKIQLNCRESQNEKQKQAQVFSENRKQRSTTTELSTAPCCQAPDNAQTNSKYRNTCISNQLQDEEYTIKHKPFYCRSTSLNEDSKNVRTADGTANVITEGTKVCVENCGLISIDEYPEKSSGNYSGIPNKPHLKIAKKDHRGLFNKCGKRKTNGHCMEIRKEYRKEIPNNYHKEILSEFPEGIQNKHHRKIITEDMSTSFGECIDRISSDHLTEIHNEYSIDKSNEYSIGISKEYSTGTSLERKTRTSTENISQICGGHCSGIIVEHVTGIPNQFSTGRSIQNNTEILNQHCKEILRQNCTGIPIGNKTNAISENVTKICGCHSGGMPYENSMGEHKEYRAKIPIIDKARKFVQNKSSRSTSKYKDSRSVPESRCVVAKAEQTSRPGQVLTSMTSDRDEPSSQGRKEGLDFVSRSKLNKSVEDTLATHSTKQQMPAIDYGNVNDNIDDYVPVDENTKTLLMKPNFLTRKTNPYIKMASDNRATTHDNVTKPTYQSKKYQTDNKRPTIEPENASTNFKKRHQTRNERNVDSELIGFVSDSNKFCDSSELCGPQQKCASEHTQATLIKRRRRNEDLSSEIVSAIADTNHINQRGTVTIFSCKGPKDFLKPLRISKQMESLSISSEEETTCTQQQSRHDCNVCKSAFLGKSLQTFRSKTPGTIKETRKSISGSKAVKRQMNDASISLNTLSTLTTDIPDEATLSLTLKCALPCDGKTHMQSGQHNQDRQVHLQPKNRINTLSVDKKKKMQNEKLDHTPSHDTVVVHGDPPLLPDNLLNENETRKQSKVNELSRGVCMGQKLYEKRKERKNTHTTTTITDDVISSPTETISIWPVPRPIYRSESRSESRLKDSAAPHSDAHLRTITLDKKRNPKRFSEIPHNEVFTFYRNQKRSDRTKESLEELSGQCRKLRLKTWADSSRTSHIDFAKNKSTNEMSTTKLVCGYVRRDNTRTQSETNGNPLKKIEHQESKRESDATKGFTNSHQAVSEQMSSQSTVNYRQTEVKKRELTTSLHQKDIEDNLKGHFRYEVVNSDPHTLVTSDSGDIEDYQLPDSLPGKIGGSIDDPSSSTVFDDRSANSDYPLTNEKEGISMNTSDIKSAPSCNVDELREKYLKEMALRGLCRDQTDNLTYGRYRTYENPHQIAECVARNQRLKVNSDTTTIRSTASSENIAPRIVLSENTMTVEDSPASYSVCGSSKIYSKQKQDNGSYPPLTSNISRSNNYIAQPNYVTNSKGHESAFPLLGQVNKTFAGSKAVIESDNITSLQQNGCDISKTPRRSSPPDISLNKSISCHTCIVRVVKQNMGQHVEKLNMEKPTDRMRFDGPRQQCYDIHDEYKSYSQCSPSAISLSVDSTEHPKQTDTGSEINKTKNATYTLDSTNSRNIHLSFQENQSHLSGLNRNCQLISTGTRGHNLSRTRSSQLPNVKKVKCNSRRNQRSNTQCLSCSRLGNYVISGNERAAQFTSSSFNNTDTKHHPQIRIEAQSKIRNSNYRDEISESDRLQIGGALSPCSSTEGSVSWLVESNVQEHVSRMSRKDVISNSSNRGHGSTLNAPTSTIWSSHCGATAAMLNEPMTKTSRNDDPIESGKPDNLTKKCPYVRCGDMSASKVTPGIVTGVLRKMCPKSILVKLHKCPAQRGEQIRKETPEMEPLSRNSKYQSLAELAEDATINRSCAVQEGTTGSQLMIDYGFGGVNLCDNRMSVAEGCFGRLNPKISTRTDERLTSYDTKENGTKPRVKPEDNFRVLAPQRTLRCVRNRKYVNSALNYSMKKQVALSPNKQKNETRQIHYGTKDPALGTNNSARLDKQDLGTTSPMLDINVTNLIVKSENQTDNKMPSSGIVQKSKGSKEYSKDDHNPVYMTKKQEKFCKKHERPKTKVESFRGRSEKEFAQQRATLAKERCGVSRCAVLRQSAQVSVNNQEQDLTKLSNSSDKTQAGKTGQFSQEDTEDNETREDGSKERHQDGYHTTGSMFVASNSCKVNFDWYKPSATLAVQSSENGQGQINGVSGSAENSQAGEIMPSRHISRLRDNLGNTIISNKYHIFQTQHRSSDIEMSYPWLALSGQEPDCARHCDETNCPLSANFISDTREATVEGTRNYVDRTNHVSLTQPNLDISCRTVSPRSRTLTSYGMSESVIHVHGERNNDVSDKTTLTSDSRQLPAPDIIAPQPRRRQASTNEHGLTAELSVSNLNSIYQTLQKDYTKTNAVFHSNWILANQNNSLSSLTPVQTQFHICTNDGTDIHSTQHQFAFGHNCNETPLENISGTCSRPEPLKMSTGNHKKPQINFTGSGNFDSNHSHRTSNLHLDQPSVYDEDIPHTRMFQSYSSENPTSSSAIRQQTCTAGGQISLPIKSRNQDGSIQLRPPVVIFQTASKTSNMPPDSEMTSRACQEFRHGKHQNQGFMLNSPYTENQ